MASDGEDEPIDAAGQDGSRFYDENEERLHGGTHDEDRDEESNSIIEERSRFKWRKWARYAKIAALTLCWCAMTWLLMTNHEHENTKVMASIKTGEVKEVEMEGAPAGDKVMITLKGAFVLIDDPRNRPMFLFAGEPDGTLKIWMQRGAERVSAEWAVRLAKTEELNTAELFKTKHTFKLSDVNKDAPLKLCFQTDIPDTFTVQFQYDKSPVPTSEAIILGWMMVLLLYALVVREIVNRTMAAVLVSTFTIAIVAHVNECPSLLQIMEFIDMNTIMQIFGLTIIANIISETGIFDWLAVLAFKLSNGHIWPMMNFFMGVSCLGAAIFDNIFTMIALTPITIRICEMMLLNPIPVLMCQIVSVNLGSFLTPWSSPVTRFVVWDEIVKANGVRYDQFLLHMVIGLLPVLVQTYIHLRLQFKNSDAMRFKDNAEKERLRRVLRIWKHTAQAMPSYSMKERAARQSVMTKVDVLRDRLKRVGRMPEKAQDFDKMLKDLKATYPLQNKRLLILCGIALIFNVLILIQMICGNYIYATLGWVAVLSALVLLIALDIETLEHIMSRIEWTTIIFLAAWYVMNSILFQMGVLEPMVNWIERTIRSSGPKHHRLVATLLILWTSAFASSIFQKLPVAAIMVNMAIRISYREELEIRLSTLIYAGLYGMCFGGNGTLFGSLTNIMCASVAEKHGYNFFFWDFLLIGFPIMIGNLVVSSIFVMFAYVWLDWI